MNTDAPRPVDPAELLRQALAGDGERPAPWSAPAIDSVAPHFPELLIQGLIGQGGMAAVYRAEQKKLGRTVALKLLRPDLAGQPEFAERFLREARALAALNNPHVLTVHDFGQSGGFCYLVTEFVDGANLRELMRLGTLSPAEVLRIVPQICAGLQFAHEHGVVHRDIKPENVLVDRQGQVKLADFGLAKLAHGAGEAALTRTSMVFGTPHYMAPEQWRATGTVDHRADIYSLGVVLYELLTGRLPVGTYEPPSRSAGVPAGIDRVVHRSLEQEPDKRYQSAREVQRDVEKESRGAPATPPATVGATPGHGIGGTLALVTAVLLLAAVGLAVWFQSAQGNAEAYRFVELQMRRNESLVAAIQVQVRKGKPWTAQIPEPVRLEVDSARFDPELVVGLGAGWAAGALLLLSLLGTLAARRARVRGSPRWQLLVAALLQWSPVLLLLDAALTAWALSWSAASNGVVPLLAACVGLATNFGLGFLLWRGLGNASARPVAPRSAGLGLGMALAAVGMAVVATAAWAATQRPAPAFFQRLPMLAVNLVGLSRERVLELLGPPQEITVTTGDMTWAYRATDGQLVANAVSIQNDRVWAAQPGDPLVPSRMPERGPYLGQDAAAAAAALGGDASNSLGTSGTATFPDGTVLQVHAGVVTAIRRDK